MKKLLMVWCLVLVSGCVTSGSAFHAKTDGDSKPRVMRGCLAKIDLRNEGQRNADNAPFTEKEPEERKTESALDAIPIVGPILSEIINSFKGSIEIMPFEVWYNDMNEEG